MVFSACHVYVVNSVGHNVVPCYDLFATRAYRWGVGEIFKGPLMGCLNQLVFSLVNSPTFKKNNGRNFRCHCDFTKRVPQKSPVRNHRDFTEGASPKSPWELICTAKYFLRNRIMVSRGETHQIHT